jgi:hypothetical protein
MDAHPASTTKQQRWVLLGATPALGDSRWFGRGRIRWRLLALDCSWPIATLGAEQSSRASTPRSPGTWQPRATPSRSGDSGAMPDSLVLPRYADGRPDELARGLRVGAPPPISARETRTSGRGLVPHRESDRSRVRRGRGTPASFGNVPGPRSTPRPTGPVVTERTSRCGQTGTLGCRNCQFADPGIQPAFEHAVRPRAAKATLRSSLEF